MPCVLTASIKLNSLTFFLFLQVGLKILLDQITGFPTRILQTAMFVKKNLPRKFLFITVVLVDMEHATNVRSNEKLCPLAVGTIRYGCATNVPRKRLL